MERDVYIIENESEPVWEFRGLLSGFLKDAERAGVKPEKHRVRLEAMTGNNLTRHTVSVYITPGRTDGAFMGDLGFDTLTFELRRNGVTSMIARGQFIPVAGKEDVRLLKLDYEKGQVHTVRKLLNRFGSYLEQPGNYIPGVI